MKLKLWFLKWLIGWADIIDGLTMILTLTLWNSTLALSAASKYARYHYYCETGIHPETTYDCD